MVRGFGPKARLNALVIDEIAHSVYGPYPTDEDYNAVAVEICESPIHTDISKLVDGMSNEADKIIARRA